VLSGNVFEWRLYVFSIWINWRKLILDFSDLSDFHWFNMNHENGQNCKTTITFFTINCSQKSFKMQKLHTIKCNVCKWHFFQITYNEKVINIWLGTVFLPTLYLTQWTLKMFLFWKTCYSHETEQLWWSLQHTISKFMCHVKKKNEKMCVISHYICRNLWPPNSDSIF